MFGEAQQVPWLLGRAVCGAETPNLRSIWSRALTDACQICEQEPRCLDWIVSSSYSHDKRELCLDECCKLRSLGEHAGVGRDETVPRVRVMVQRAAAPSHRVLTCAGRSGRAEQASRRPESQTGRSRWAAGSSYRGRTGTACARSLMLPAPGAGSARAAALSRGRPRSPQALHLGTAGRSWPARGHSGRARRAPGTPGGC